MKSSLRGRRQPDHIGINTYTERLARRITATYQLSCDRSAPILARLIARLVSIYERAPLLWWLHELLVLPMFLDSAPLWLIRRLAFALTGRERGDDDPGLDRQELPSSGWIGNVLVLLVWLMILLITFIVFTMLLLGRSSI